MGNATILLVGGAIAGAVYLATRSSVEARWYRTAKHRLVDRFHHASFAAMVESQVARIDAASNAFDREGVLGEWRDVMETDPYADLKRSGHDGYTRLAELDQASADTLRAAYDAYEAYKVAAATWYADWSDSTDRKADFVRVLRATATALDNARRVPVELPPKTSTTEDIADAAGRGASSVGNALASAYGSLAQGAGKLAGAFTKGALGGASEQLIVLGGVALFAVFVLPRLLPAVRP